MKKEVCYTKTNKKRRVTGETGMKYADPYTPGAGFMPGHIAGRKETLERAEKYLNTIVLGYPRAVRNLLRITWCRKDGVVKCDRM